VSSFGSAQRATRDFAGRLRRAARRSTGAKRARGNRLHLPAARAHFPARSPCRPTTSFRTRTNARRPRTGDGSKTRISRSLGRRTARTVGRSSPSRSLAPDDGTASEQWGFEGPRVVWVEELDRWVITCTAYGPAGPAVFLATTEDFRTVERYGVIRHPEDKNAALLPIGSTADGCSCTARRPSSGVATARFFSPAPTTSSAGARPSRVL
jgi:beta-1,4-mannooligosaccharide phosphorylase